MSLRAARARTVEVDDAVRSLLTPDAAFAAVAVGAYGRQELTPRAEVELLLLHSGELSLRSVTETVAYPLWERGIRLEPLLRTPLECLADQRRSLTLALGFLDARLVVGDADLFREFEQRVVQPLRADRRTLRRRTIADVERRHAAHPSVADATLPDLVEGRGGLRDLQALRCLDPSSARDERVVAALDYLLQVLTVVERLAGHIPHRLVARLQERVAAALEFHQGQGPDGASLLMERLYQHARWVAFLLDGALVEPRPDRSFGVSLSVRQGELSAERLPDLARVPSLGLSVAHLVGLAPPDRPLLVWSCTPGPPIDWEASTLEQWWLLLRAADWRAWSYLDVTGLLLRYLPEWSAIARQRGEATVTGMALDSHSFLALRRLHEWLESSDPFANRLWRTLRHRDWVYLAVLIHELGPQAVDVGQRMGLSSEAVATIAFLAENVGLVAEIAAQRDLHDEDLMLELAARIGNRQRLRMLFLVAVAHALAQGGDAWTTWQAALWRKLFGLLDDGLRQSAEIGVRRSRSVEHHREQVVRALGRRNLADLSAVVARLPRRYLLTRSAAFTARHLALLAGAPLGDGEVRVRAHRQRLAPEWDLVIVARDRPGLLATVAGVLALRGASVLAADAATTADGLALDVFTVGSAYGAPLEPSVWPRVKNDLQAALDGSLPLDALLATAPLDGADQAHDEVRVRVDNAVSQFYSVIEIRAPDRVGLLYRITRAFHRLGLDIHHAKVATHPDGALDVFYVWDLAGNKLGEDRAEAVAADLTAALTA